MAKLDDLIEQVVEPARRSDLEQAARELRQRKTFGLVFEEHIPEITLLRDFPVKPGATVYRRDDTATETPMVMPGRSGPLTCRSPTEPSGLVKSRSPAAAGLLYRVPQRGLLHHLGGCDRGIVAVATSLGQAPWLCPRCAEAGQGGPGFWLPKKGGGGLRHAGTPAGGGSKQPR